MIIDSLPGQAVPRRRWIIAALLGGSVLINYFDRLNLAVAAPLLRVELHLSPLMLGVLLSTFSWSYAVCQIPSGLILDRFGVKWVGRIGLLLWGMSSAVTALARGYTGILLARLLLGIAEAPSFPLNAKAVGHWFPRQERSTATAIFDGMSKFSQVIGVPIVALVAVRFGWRGAFWFTAILSFLFLFLFWMTYREPSEDRRLSPVEHDYIVSGGAVPEGRSDHPVFSTLGYLLKQRKVWGLSIGFACFGYSNAMFQAWLPTYFVQTQNVGLMKSASFTMLPWFVATIAQLVVGGWLVDWLIQRGHDETRVRKSIIIICMVLGLAMIGVIFTARIFWILFWMTLSVSALTAAATIGWSLPSLVAPRGGVATVGSIQNTVNASVSSLAPIVTGYVLQITGSFAAAFVVAACVLVVGMCSYGLLMGPIEPLPDIPDRRPTTNTIYGQAG